MDQEVTGILPLWKPRGMTSFSAVQEVKKIFYTRKAGHTGTLDPDVNGVLPICLGRATKLVEYLTADKKTYEGEVTLGFSTTTEDSSGEKVEEKAIVDDITEKQVNEVLQDLTGEITQTPPMFSAVKIKGKRLYEYAREGITIERPSRQVTIYDITLDSAVEKTTEGNVRFRFTVTCSKGTYIRTLSVMIGEKLGYPAHMSLLTRTQSGVFTKENCITLEELQILKNDNKLGNSLLSIEDALADYPKVIIDNELELKVLNGAILEEEAINIDEFPVALYNRHGECLALYEKHPKRHGMLKPAKMLARINS